jgi:hypothetical protein
MISPGQLLVASVGNAASSEVAQQAIASLDLFRGNHNGERLVRGPRQSGTEKIDSVFDAANNTRSINPLHNITDIKQLKLAKQVVGFVVKELGCRVKSILKVGR